MLAIVRLVTILTGSVVFLTCSNLVELLKLWINTRVAKSGIRNSWLVYIITPMICILISFALIELSIRLPSNPV